MAIELYSKATLDTLLAGKLSEAPIDGNLYGRKDGAWEIIPPSGSATWGAITGTVTDQTDLTSYLSSNYYPLSGNPSGFLTSVPGKVVTNVDLNSANYYLAIGDANNIVNAQGDGSSSGYVIYIPTNASVTFPIGTEVLFTNIGGGFNYINGDSGVTVIQTSNSLNSGYMRKAVKLDTDTWLISSQI